MGIYSYKPRKPVLDAPESPQRASNGSLYVLAFVLAIFPEFFPELLPANAIYSHYL